MQPIATSRRRSVGARAAGAHVVGLWALGVLVSGVLTVFPAAASEQKSQVSSSVGDAQATPRQGKADGAEVRVYAYTFRNKRATEALTLVQPLLTRHGSLEIQPEDNTLVVRDTVAALGRIVPTLRAFDRPPQALRIEVMIVRAGVRPPGNPGTESLPSWLEERLRGLLRWDYYSLLARSDLDTQEGQEVTHEVGGLYGLSFRPGTLGPDNQLKLHEFRIWHAGKQADPPLLEATLNLWLGKPKVLGLANSESADRALMVVLTCERIDSEAGNDGAAAAPPSHRRGGR